MSTNTITPGTLQKQAGASKTETKPSGRMKEVCPTRTEKRPASGKRPTTSKSSTMLGLLTRKTGCTLSELQQASGWQAHSVRGFLSGTVSKKLGYKLESTIGAKGVRRYQAFKTTAT